MGYNGVGLHERTCGRGPRPKHSLVTNFLMNLKIVATYSALFAYFKISGGDVSMVGNDSSLGKPAVHCVNRKLQSHVE